ncbi:hypothetical protein [Enterocloster clostridioformis]|uniref:sodium:calcium antiporter n=1 Tax=Enterocloster clostridioformis TaxID=1531 RepID=UPI000414262E|nr:hypothetical protein [Enterocloster clostridioformis]
MFICVSLFIVGLVCLIKGGDWFVDGATGIARKFHLPELLIGATVVSIGTTLPEVMVSTTSALTGHSEMAYGNAIGSVICNTALIAAITVAIKPGKINRETLRTPVLFFFIGRHLHRCGLFPGLFQPDHRICAAGDLRGLYGHHGVPDEKQPPGPGRRG